MKYCIYLVALVAIISSCSSANKTASQLKDDGKIEVVFIQVNDVYEIAPLSGGNYGGMARVATLKKQELRSNPNTFLVIAGDFLSPSVYNSLQYEGARVRGRQMVDVMNAVGFDLAIFGNHEFDITENELQNRINESSFRWISSNAFHKQNDSVTPFVKYGKSGSAPIPVSQIISVTDADGTKARIGVMGLTITSNNAGYVKYSDPLESAKTLYNQLKDSCDAVIAITHQTIREDIILAEQLPGLSMIIGGHEHDMRFNKTGNVIITKAFANARTAYVLKLAINKNSRTTEVTPELKELDQGVSLDDSTDKVVKKWMNIANSSYASAGFDPRQILLSAGDSLDGREAMVRRAPTNLTQLVLSGMAFACPDADMVIVNAGSIRVDDVLYPPVSQYDILRSLPFGGSIREVQMKGSLLKQVLDTGMSNRGRSGFLLCQPANVNIDTTKVYRVGLSDYLLTGAEQNLHFLKKDNPAIVKLYDEQTSTADPRSDIRLAIVRFLQEKIK